MTHSKFMYFVIVVLAGISPSRASFHLWDISEIYSNADGTIQFIELASDVDGQGLLTNHDLIATSDGNAIVYTIPTDVAATTADHKLLFATAAFSSEEGGITPDYIIPDQFFDPAAGNILLDFAGADNLAFTNSQLPTGGFLSLYPDLTTAPNSPTNFAGDVGLLNDLIFYDGFFCPGAFLAYPDVDEDLFGDINAVPVLLCEITTGFVDNNLDCDDSTSAINPGMTDLPDQSFIDSNCDGIDGDIVEAIFVSTNGDVSNPGTLAEPKLTINDGISEAILTNKSQVYVALGTYDELVTLADGISLYGAYDDLDEWSRGTIKSTLTSAANIDIHRVAVTGAQLLSPTVIDSFDISTTDTFAMGASNYAVHCVDCDGLVIENNTIHSGNAGHGMPGSNGIPGRDGINGNPGVNGCDNTNCGFGGSQTVSPFGEFGGNGGDGGYDSASGQNGSVGSAGTSAGNGGTGSNCFAGGNNGGNAADVVADGLPGQAGTDGTSFSIINNFWIGDAGTAGTNGINGEGGSGGGGGGGGDNAGGICNSDKGGGGGSGGTGGEGGTGGTGGLAGGSSFAVFLINSLSVQLNNNTITSGLAGNGGVGGLGGIGGIKGLGASGGSGNDDSGDGGDGGNGGAGGDGGDGGKGADGVSQPVYNN